MAIFYTDSASFNNLEVTGSVYLNTLTEQPQNSVVVFNTASGQLHYTASYAIGRPSFPFSGSAVITGSLLVSGSGIVVTGSLNAPSITGSLEGTASWAQNAITSSYPLLVSSLEAGAFAQPTLYYAGAFSPSAIPIANVSNSIILGNSAGARDATANDMIAIGAFAGSGSYSASFSVNVGRRAGQDAGEANRSVNIGFSAGQTARYANNSIFIGTSAGSGATSASYSQFMGISAGTNATSATLTTIIGYEAGRSALNASHSFFAGFKAGWAAVSASYNTLIGFNVGNYTASAFGLISGSYVSGSAGAWGNPSATLNKLGYNNIIIGNNITMPANTNNSVNLGAVLFVSGTYFNPSSGSNPYSGSNNGNVGINIPSPQYSLDVSGSGNFTNGLVVSGSGQVFTISSSSIVLLSMSSSARLTIGPSTGAPTPSIYAPNSIFSIISAGAFTISNESNNSLLFGTNNVNRWYIAGSGEFMAISDNQYDIGTSGNLRPRNLYIAGTGSFAAGLFATGSIFTQNSTIRINGAPSSYTITGGSTVPTINIQGPEAGSNRHAGLSLHQTDTGQVPPRISFFKSYNGINAMVNTSYLGQIDFYGAYNSTPTFGKGASVYVKTSDNSWGTYTAANHPARFAIATVLSGSTTLEDRYVIDFDGTHILSGSVVISGSQNITGSLTVTAGITGSLQGTASWATNALTASYVNPLSQSVIITGSLTVSGSSTIRSALGTGTAFQVLSGSSTILYAGTNISQTRVGIRTSSPAYSFDVNGNTNFTPEEHSGYVRISPGQSSTWNNPTFFQTSFGSTLMLNNAYYTASSGQFIRAVNGYAAGIQLEPSLGGIELFTAPYGNAGTAFNAFTSRISITNSGSVGINNTLPSYSLDVSGSGNYTNGLTVTGSLNAPNITGSLQGTASYVTGSIFTSTNLALSASYALTSSYSAYSDTSTQASSTIITVINQTGTQINKGIVVRITGSNTSSDIPRIDIADYTNDNYSANTIGLVMANIANGDTGSVLTEGTFIGYDTDTPGWTSGQLVFLGANGAITGSAPKAPLHAVRLGQVIRKQTNNGSIYIRIDNGYELDELHDVAITNVVNGNLLIQSSSVWTNSNQLTGSYGLTGSLTFTNGGITGSLFGTASWAQSASNAVNTQTASFLPVATYQITSSWAVSASQATSASYALNGGVTQIIAGTNIAISPTNGLGAVTINSSGGSGGAGANVSSSFTNQSTWTFSHLLGNRAVVVQTYDTSWNQIIPQSITLTDTNTATITFPSNQSGFAVASVGGTASTTNAATASYVNALTQSVNITGDVTASIFAATNNGNGTNFKVGDDAWIGDINTANTIGIKGQQNATNGYIKFGSGSSNPTLGSSGTSTLELTGALSLASGSITLTTGSITMPNRPAFRVTGAGGGKTAVTVLSGSYLNVDYQQGSGWDNATGTFTAPIAGLYQVNVVVRTNSNSLGTISQLIVYKNNTSTSPLDGTTQIMVEFGSNTTMNHAGGSTIAKLAVGDTLKMVVTVGQISFDSNDNFSVAYIG